MLQALYEGDILEIQLVNVVGVIFGLIPLLIVIITAKEYKPVYHRFWIYGFVFIALAAALFAVLNSLTLVAMGIEVSTLDDKSTLNGIKNTLSVWTYIGPAAIAALGVNLITEFITKEKPATE